MSLFVPARLVGSLLLALGLAAAVEVFRIKDDWSGARLVPAVVAVALLALGAAHWLAPASRPRAGGPAEPPASGRGAGAVVLVLALLVAYVVLLPGLGFLPATAALVALLLRRLGAYRWAAAMAVGLGVAVACHVVFRLWLAMALPDGLLAR